MPSVSSHRYVEKETIIGEKSTNRPCEMQPCLIFDINSIHDQLRINIAHNRVQMESQSQYMTAYNYRYIEDMKCNMQSNI